MAWAKDESKLNRVRGLMKDQEVSAVVARPDNVPVSHQLLVHEGYDAVVFRKKRSHVDRSRAPARRAAQFLDGGSQALQRIDERDPQPAPFRPLDLALETLRSAALHG